MNQSSVLPLTSRNLALALVGGKARSLARLAAAGLPVPAGFILSTPAYEQFIEQNELQASIVQRFVEKNFSDPTSVEQASAAWQSHFAAAIVPDSIAADVGRAYADLTPGGHAVAVRSSATAEDLPELSFAGQQDSFLNVCGEAALLEAIRGCWISLWTPRAMAYREQMGVEQRSIAMAVIVQRMLMSDVSGVLFTANPLNGDRSELVVNASFGLGEAVVSGQVVPDTFALDRTTLQVKRTVLGDKRSMVVASGTDGTTTQPIPEQQRDTASMSEQLLRELASLSLQAERLFGGVPQDIEWAVANGKCWLLQSRPITKLPAAPLPAVSWDPPRKGVKLIRRQVVENMPGPLSPLFEELYLSVGLEHATDHFVATFDIPFDIEEIVERPMFLTVNGYAYCRASYRPGWRILRVMPKLLVWYVFSCRKLLRNVIPRWRDEGLPTYLETIQHWKAYDATSISDQQLLAGIRELAVADATYWFDVAIVLGAAKVTDGLLNRFLSCRFVPGDLTSGAFLRGFPSMPLQAEQQLEAIAKDIRETDSLRDLVMRTPVAALCGALSREPNGQHILGEIRKYLDVYGHQVYTLDFGEPTLQEDPRPVLLSLAALVNNPSYDSLDRQSRLAESRETLIHDVAGKLGPLRRWVFRKLLGWAQTYGPYREQSLFYIGAAWPTLRRFALELGKRLVDAGTLPAAEDVFYLASSELAQASTAGKRGRGCPELRELAWQRRELREARQRLHPPGMIPPASRFKIGPFDFSAFETQKRNRDDAQVLQGFPVSPGRVTGTASVILSPQDFDQMQPNTILVCPTTTPAWTPLFSQATGLVTDIGGILAHGSIVAREYGIPAVMGTGNVTQRIKSGQQICVDGDAGTVEIL